MNDKSSESANTLPFSAVFCDTIVELHVLSTVVEAPEHEVTQQAQNVIDREEFAQSAIFAALGCTGFSMEKGEK